MQVSDAIVDALRELQVVALDEGAQPDQLSFGARKLDRMLRAWQTLRYLLYTETSQSVTVTTSALYVLPIRYIRIDNINYKNSDGIETPMCPMMRNEYLQLPQKTSTGIPTQYYVDRQAGQTNLYIWPLMATASGTLEISGERALADMTDVTAELDCPREWDEAVVTNLALSMAAAFNRDPNMVAVAAQSSLAALLADDREDSVYFYGEDE